jgi:hypothetical protein
MVKESFFKTRYAMKALIVNLLATCLFSFAVGAFPANEQKVFSVASTWDAEVEVFVADSKWDADLLVYRVSSKYETDGNKGLWFFVDYTYDAGWRSADKKHLMF